MLHKTIKRLFFGVTVTLLFPFPLQNGSFEGFSFFCLAGTSGYVDRPLGTYLNGQTSSKHLQDSASTVLSRWVPHPKKYTPERFGRRFSLSMRCILRFHVNLPGCSLKPGTQIAHPNGSEAFGIAKVVILMEIAWKTRMFHGFCLVEYHILKLAAETHTWNTGLIQLSFGSSWCKKSPQRWSFHFHIALHRLNLCGLAGRWFCCANRNHWNLHMIHNDSSHSNLGFRSSIFIYYNEMVFC